MYREPKLRNCSTQQLKKGYSGKDELIWASLAFSILPLASASLTFSAEAMGLEYK